MGGGGGSGNQPETGGCGCVEAGQRPRGCPRLPPARPTQTHAAVKPFPASWAPSDLGAQFPPHSRQQCPGVGSQSLGCPAPPDRHPVAWRDGGGGAGRGRLWRHFPAQRNHESEGSPTLGSQRGLPGGRRRELSPRGVTGEQNAACHPGGPPHSLPLGSCLGVTWGGWNQTREFKSWVCCLCAR